MPPWSQERTRSDENTLAVKNEAGAPGRPRSVPPAPSLSRAPSLVPLSWLRVTQWVNLRCRQTLGQPQLTFCMCCFFTLGPNRTRLESRSKGVFQNATPGAEGLAGRWPAL